MRYHQHRAREIRQGGFDRQRRRQIQVVGRFVQQQQLRRLSPPQRAGQRRLEPFAAAQRAQRQRDAIRTKLQLRQPGAQRAFRQRRILQPQMVHHRQTRVELRQGLIEVGRRQRAMTMAGKRRQLTENGFQQGGFAAAVGAGQRHAHRAVDTQIQRRRADERQLQLLEHQHLLVRAHLAARQRQQHRLLVLHPLIGLAHRRIEAVALVLMLFSQRAEALLRRRFVSHPFERGDVQRIDDAQRLRRAPLAHVVLFLLTGTGAAALLARMFQIGARRLLLHVALAPVVVVVAAVAAQRAGRQFDDALHTPQQLPVMAGDQQPAAPLIQLLIQPGAPGAVEVVGRFVQQQIIRLPQKSTAQRRAHPFATAQ